MATLRFSRLLLLPTTMAAACFLLLLLALYAAPAPAHGGGALMTRGGAGAGAVTKAAQQGGTSSNATATADEYLEPHNQARAAVGVAPLRWSGDLASVAAAAVARQQQQGGRCAFADMSGSPYGAIQGWARKRVPPRVVVASWVAAGRYYNHANNTCAAGQQCGTYTQVVWRRTTELGCAQADCATGATLTICLYNPRGNVQGQSPY